MNVIDWPSDLRVIAGHSWHLAVSSGTPGRGLGGHQQIIFRENRYWQCDLKIVPLRRRQIPTWQAFVDELCGMANPIRLPLCNVWRPRPAGGSFNYEAAGLDPEEIANGVRFSDTAFFDDGSGWSFPGVPDPSIAQAAPAGATILRMTGPTVAMLQPGVMFTIDGYLYRIAGRSGQQVRFNPPLRQDVASGVQVNISAPYVIVRLADDDQARAFVNAERWTDAMTVSVVEAFDR